MKVLFICKSNVGRSQMADAFFNDSSNDHVAISAGTHVKPENDGQPISKTRYKVIGCMKEVGFEVESNIMNQLTKEMVDESDIVVAITPKETLPEYLQTSSKLRVWDIPDASGTDMDFHRKVRDMVKKGVDELVKEID